MPIKLRHQEEVKTISFAVLGVVAAAGLIAAVAIAPGVAMAFRSFRHRSSSRQRYDMDRALRRLVRRGFVTEVPRRRGEHYRLTDRGRAHLMRRELACAVFEQPKRWDGKWRLITFDVPERFRYLRDTLRNHLRRLGLAPIQQSVWLTPSPCDDLIRMLKIDLALGRRIQSFTIGSFDDRAEERSWRRHFDV